MDRHAKLCAFIRSLSAIHIYIYVCVCMYSYSLKAYDYFTSTKVASEYWDTSTTWKKQKMDTQHPVVSQVRDKIGHNW